MLKYFHETAVAHNIKDLEKALPSIASINSMQVKDYIQALSDDSKIHVEKIGSGNWYWSFPGEARKAKEDQVAKATDERDKAAASVRELQAKTDDARALREAEESENMLLEVGQDRGSLTTRHADLGKELQPLRVELVGYQENDPVEVEKKRKQVGSLVQQVDMLTEQIQCMEGHIRDVFMGGDRSAMLLHMQNWYGDQFDDEEQGLREIT